MNLTTIAEISTLQTHSSETTQSLPIGAYMVDRVGRGYRYCKNSTVALVAGNVIQAVAQTTTHQNLTATANSIGDTSAVATLGALAAAANLYAEGIFQVDTTPDIGSSYGIASHAAVLSGGVITATLYSDDPIVVAWTSSTRVGLWQNAYKNVIQSPTTATGIIVGVAPFAIPASTTTVDYFGWIQTHGPASVLVAGTPAVAQGVGYSATAGACAINSSTLYMIGYIGFSGQAGLCQIVMLTID